MKIRIGFGLGAAAAGGLDGAGFAAVVDAAERIGWDSMWFSERVAGPTLDPLAAMGVAVGRTRRLKFGTSVLVLPGRNPVLLAKELATLDVLSGGRIVPVFGLGAPFPHESEAFGVDRRERAGRTEEAVRLMIMLWMQDSVTFEGRFVSVHDLSISPKPLQQPHPDVWFGGQSEAACRRVGRLGTGWLPSFVAPAEYKSKADVVRAEARRAGREIEEDHYGALVVYVPRAEGAERALALAAARRPGTDPRDLVVIGGPQKLRARLEEFMLAGASKFVVLPFSPPINWEDELASLYETVVRPLEA